MRRGFAGPAAALAPYAALFAALLWPLILLKKTFVLGDYDLQHFPWALHYWRALRSGVFPFWTDLIAGGFPFAAEGQTGPFYPLNFVTFLTLPFLAAYTWSIVFHLLFGGAGFWMYTRALGLSSKAAALGMLAFSFGSAYGGCFYNTATLRVLSWLPWALWLCEKARQKGGGRDAPVAARLAAEKLPPQRPVGRARFAAALAIVFSQQWTAGFPQVAVYAFGYCALHELFVFFGRPRGERRAAGRGLIWLAAALLGGALLALPQILLTAELASESLRAGESAAFALWGSAPPPGILSLFFPRWGNAFRISFYIGIAPLFFAAATAWLPRHLPAGQAGASPAAAGRHAALAAFFFLAALGKFNPLYEWFVRASGFTAFRVPSKFLFFAAFALAVLAGIGFDRFFAALGDPKERARAAKRALYAGAAFVLIPAALAAAAPAIVNRAVPALENAAQSYAQSVGGAGAESPPAGGQTTRVREKIRVFVAGLASELDIRNPLNLKSVLVAAVLLALLVGACLPAGRFAAGRAEARVFALAALLLTAGDLYHFGRTMGVGFIGNAASPPAGEFSSEAETLRNLAGPEGTTAEFVRDASNEMFTPNRNMLWHVRHAGGYSPLLPRRYYELAYPLGIVDGALGRKPVSEEDWRVRKGLLDALGVAAVRSDAPLAVPGFSEAGRKAGDSVFYRNADARGFLSGFYDWKVVSEKAERVRVLNGPFFEPSSPIVEQDLPSKPAPGLGIEKGRMSHGMKGTAFEGEITMRRAGIGVARLAAYPGWALFVDGKKEDWFYANHAFLGFLLPEGRHEVRLEFRPTRFRAAAAASGAGWAAVLAVLVFAGFLGRRPVYNDAP